ncbi:MAG TPA: hypothetical protein VK250_09190 [Nitrososphaeraceae archaeon]|nr:hypothetical protein [Nitrososphaeraceae archaeon]
MTDQSNNQEKIIEELKSEISELKNQLRSLNLNFPDKKPQFIAKIPNEVFFRFVERNSITSLDDLKNSDILVNGTIDLTDKDIGTGEDMFHCQIHMLRMGAGDL